MEEEEMRISSMRVRKCPKCGEGVILTSFPEPTWLFHCLHCNEKFLKREFTGERMNFEGDKYSKEFVGFLEAMLREYDEEVAICQ